MARRRFRPIRTALTTIALTLAAPSGAQSGPATRPMIFPAPVSLRLTGDDLSLDTSVVLVRPAGTDAATMALVEQSLRAAGVTDVRTASRLPARLDATHVVIGTADTATIRDALSRAGGEAPDKPEGYTLNSARRDEGGLIVLAGRDADGLFHGAQTFRQLASAGRFPAVAVRDYPAMPVRGTIEGFYGAPWTTTDRMAHLALLGRVKANTYIYSPKDDPFARDRWREDYPSDKLQELGTLVAEAERQHVDFVYAVSPGPSICYSDPADLQALRRKFDAFRKLGVHGFYVALDDIEYKEWNCERDKATFGPSGEAAAAKAQAFILNAVQRDLGESALMMVPTEYYNTTESPYKATLRAELDPRIVVQWTGTDVVPPSISVNDAKAATKAFGRKTLLWDNYPVNDFKETAGRLLMAPYARREGGLSDELTGIVSNPMNQEAPSRVAVMGLNAFAWNDRGYDVDLAWDAAARDLAGGDPRVTAALLTFFDTQHLAPTFGTHPWQPQAPGLKRALDDVRLSLAKGDAVTRAAALDDLSRTADELTLASDVIRAGVADKGFVAQSAPWLDALQLWGRSLQLTAEGLRAANDGTPAAKRFFHDADRLAKQAAAVKSIPGATRFDGPIKLADGVLDTFIADAPGLIHIPD